MAQLLWSAPQKSFEHWYQRHRWLKTNLIPSHYRRGGKKMKIITICSKIEDSVRTTSPPSSLISCFLPLRPPPLAPLWGLVLAVEARLQRLGSRLGAAAGKSQGGTECRSGSADWWALASSQLRRPPPIVHKSVQPAAKSSSAHFCTVVLHRLSSVQ